VLDSESLAPPSEPTGKGSSRKMLLARDAPAGEDSEVVALLSESTPPALDGASGGGLMPPPPVSVPLPPNHDGCGVGASPSPAPAPPPRPSTEPARLWHTELSGVAMGFSTAVARLSRSNKRELLERCWPRPPERAFSPPPAAPPPPGLPGSPNTAR
jgi:hypothetical protein